MKAAPAAFAHSNILLLMDLYGGRFGDEGMNRLNEVVASVKAGRMTFRQAAATLGITYYEFVSLQDEAGALLL
jgi:hypothetical protein